MHGLRNTVLLELLLVSGRHQKLQSMVSRRRQPDSRKNKLETFFSRVGRLSRLPMTALWRGR
jgi:hypothetical protein